MTKSGPSKDLSLLRLGLGTLSLVVVLTMAGGWALPVVFFSILLIIALHELGHFATAKWTGMRVNSFFVGFGPTLWSWQRGETTYGVKALPLGGFVKIVGMTSVEEVSDVDEARSFRSATFPRRVLVASAGSLVHLILAVALAVSSLMIFGAADTSHVAVAGFNSWDGMARNAAQQAGLEIGDVVVQLDGKVISTPTQLATVIHARAGRNIFIVIERHGRRIALHAMPVDGRAIRTGGTWLEAPTNPTAVGYLGIGLEYPTIHDGLFSGVNHGVREVGSLATSSVASLWDRLSPSGLGNLFDQVTNAKLAVSPAQQNSRPESVVGIVRLAVQGAQSGSENLLYILMALNVFVGVINMLPLLPLDGGHVAIACYERLRSRRGSRYRADIAKMTPVIYAFMGVLAFLFACSLYLDLAHPIANPFH